MKKASVKNALIQQLKFKHASIDCFIDLIQDYISFWEIKTKLIEDIDNRGVVYEDYSSVGIKMQKNNPSVKELVAVNKQMLAILKDLGLSTDRVINKDDITDEDAKL